MTHTDKYLYYGVWGVLVGFALYYGWRIALGLLAPYAGDLIGSILTDREFNPIIMGHLLNGLLHVISGLVSSIIVALFIRFAIKPDSMLFVFIPLLIMFGSSYWWLVEAIYEGTVFFNSQLLLSYVPGPIIIGIVFTLMYRFISLKRSENNTVGVSS